MPVASGKSYKTNVPTGYNTKKKKKKKIKKKLKPKTKKVKRGSYK